MTTYGSMQYCNSFSRWKPKFPSKMRELHRKWIIKAPSLFSLGNESEYMIYEYTHHYIY